MRSIALTLALAMICAAAGAQDVRWSPAGLDTKEGNGNLAAPFWSRAATVVDVGNAIVTGFVTR